MKPEGELGGIAAVDGMIRVAVADDHALLRQGLIMLMRGAHPDWSFHEAGCFEDALGLLAGNADAPDPSKGADLLLIDLRMPGMAGGESLRILRERHPRTRIAVLTATEDRATILECLDAGVHGYILKSDAAETMLGAIETLLDGGVYVPPALTRLQAAYQPPYQAAYPAAAPASPLAPTPPLAPTLTPRQNDVLALLAEGRSTKDIARRLNLGLGTVKVHLAGIYRALGAANRMEAVVRAGRLTLVDLTLVE